MGPASGAAATLTINLGALAANYRLLQSHLQPGCECWERLQIRFTIHFRLLSKKLMIERSKFTHGSILFGLTIQPQSLISILLTFLKGPLPWTTVRSAGWTREIQMRGHIL